MISHIKNLLGLTKGHGVDAIAIASYTRYNPSFSK